MKNDCYNFPEPEVESLYSLFYLIKPQISVDLHILYIKEEQQTLTFEKLEPKKMTETIIWLAKCFSVKRKMVHWLENNRIEYVYTYTSWALRNCDGHRSLYSDIL